MWGKDFRVVRDGLAETDVVLFVEGLMSREKEGLDKLQHVEALHELARRTVEDAEKIAVAARDEGLRLSEEQAGRIVSTAQQQAQDVVDQSAKAAQERAEQLVEEIVEAAATRVASLEASLSERVEQRIMRVEQAVRTWLGSVRPLVAVWNIEQFNKLVVEAESLLTLDDPADPALEDKGPSRQTLPGAPC
jgi:hypothetical protein